LAILQAELRTEGGYSRNLESIPSQAQILAGAV
jgi:hypothetical protein